MGQLDARAHALPVNEANDPAQFGNMLILPDAQIAGRDAPLRSDRSRLQQDHPRASLRARSQMNQVPVVGKSIPGRILAHRRDPDAVGELNGT